MALYMYMVSIITGVLIWGEICSLGFSGNKWGWNYNRLQYIEGALYTRYNWEYNILCGLQNNISLWVLIKCNTM